MDIKNKHPILDSTKQTKREKTNLTEKIKKIQSRA